MKHSRAFGANGKAGNGTWKLEMELETGNGTGNWEWNLETGNGNGNWKWNWKLLAVAVLVGVLFLGISEPISSFGSLVC